MLSETQGARESRPEQKRTYWCNKVAWLLRPSMKKKKRKVGADEKYPAQKGLQLKPLIKLNKGYSR